MRRLALLMIFSIVATMTFGCGKTEGEEKSTKEEVTTIQETEEPLETKDDKVDLLEYIDELKKLPPHKGGGYVINNHPDEVILVPAYSKVELLDIDTNEDMQIIKKIISEQDD